MDFDPTPPQQELIDAAAAVARESLAPRASLYDRTGAHPRESWHDLWRHGFLAAAVPVKYGGRGLDMPSYVMLLEQLAQGASTPP
jgi:alkylation response protein AidB-like acyl-CoA dehydrogenase